MIKEYLHIVGWILWFGLGIGITKLFSYTIEQAMDFSPFGIIALSFGFVILWISGIVKLIYSLCFYIYRYNPFHITISQIYVLISIISIVYGGYKFNVLEVLSRNDGVLLNGLKFCFLLTFIPAYFHMPLFYKTRLIQQIEREIEENNFKQ